MTLSRGDSPWFLAFCPNGAQGDSPGQRPVGSNVAIESRPEGSEPNGTEIHASTYPGRRFALPWAISFCPFGAEKQKTPTARGLSPVSRSISRSNRPSARKKRQAFRHAIARGLSPASFPRVLVQDVIYSPFRPIQACQIRFLVIL